MRAMNAEQLEPELLDAYIKERILPAVSGGGGAFTLEPVKGGSRNLIWFLSLEDGRRLVLKAVSKRFRIKNIIRAHGFLARRGIPVPRLLFADRTWKTAGALGYYIACEEWIDGTPLAELGERRACHIPQLTALFARMHATRSYRWGKIKSFQFFGFSDYILRKTAERAQALAESDCTPEGAPEQIQAWFEQKRALLKTRQGFSLCHGDVNMQNILLCPDEKIRLIDTEAFKFLPFPIEYFRLAYGLCGFDQAAHQQFQSSYAAAAPHKNLLLLQRLGFFYHAYVLLEIAWHFNKKLKRESAPAAERPGFVESRGKALDHLAEVIRNNS